MRRRNRAALHVALALAACLPAGCVERPRWRAPHYLSSQRELGRIRRVAFVELTDETSGRGITDQMTQALLHALQDRGRFRVDIIRRSDPLCRDLPLEPLARHTLDQIAELRRVLEYDAVLFGSASDFQPYPRMRVALSLNLLDLKRAKVIWALEHTWDGTEKQTQQRADRYFKQQFGRGYDPLKADIIFMSPQHFAKFVAFEATMTLDRPEPQPPRP